MFDVWIVVNKNSNAKKRYSEDESTYWQHWEQHTVNCRWTPRSSNNFSIIRLQEIESLDSSSS